MAAKFVVLVCFLGAASAGYVAPVSPVAYSSVTSEQQNTLRSFGNLAQVSTFSKTIDTPFSSVAKSDVRVSNPGFVSTPLSYPAPIGYPAPLTYSAQAPFAYPAPAPLAYSAQAPLAYSAPAQVAYPAPAPVAYAAKYPEVPVAYSGPVTSKVVTPTLLGVAYSAAPLVSHMTYSNGYGIAYSY